MRRRELVVGGHLGNAGIYGAGWHLGCRLGVLDERHHIDFDDKHFGHRFPVFIRGLGLRQLVRVRLGVERLRVRVRWHD